MTLPAIRGIPLRAVCGDCGAGLKAYTPPAHGTPGVGVCPTHGPCYDPPVVVAR